jgi:hypothetical protein
MKVSSSPEAGAFFMDARLAIVEAGVRKERPYLGEDCP